MEEFKGNICMQKDVNYDWNKPHPQPVEEIVATDLDGKEMVAGKDSIIGKLNELIRAFNNK